MRTLNAEEFSNLVKSVHPVRFAKSKILLWAGAFLIFLVLPNAVMWNGKDHFADGSVERWLSFGFHFITLILAGAGFIHYLFHSLNSSIMEAFFLKMLSEYENRNRVGYTLRFHEYKDGTSWTDLVHPRGHIVARHFKNVDDEYIHSPRFNEPGFYASMNLSTVVGEVVNTKVKKPDEPLLTTKVCEYLSPFTATLFFCDHHGNILKLGVKDMLGLLMSTYKPKSQINLQSLFHRQMNLAKRYEGMMGWSKKSATGC